MSLKNLGIVILFWVLFPNLVFFPELHRSYKFVYRVISRDCTLTSPRVDTHRWGAVTRVGGDIYHSRQRCRAVLWRLCSGCRLKRGHWGVPRIDRAICCGLAIKLGTLLV